MGLIGFKTLAKPRNRIQQEKEKGQRDLGSEIERRIVCLIIEAKPIANSFQFFI